MDSSSGPTKTASHPVDRLNSTIAPPPRDLEKKLKEVSRLAFSLNSVRVSTALDTSVTHRLDGWAVLSLTQLSVA